MNRVTHSELFQALRDLIQWGDTAELPLDKDSDYVGVQGIRNGLNTTPDTEAIEHSARLLRYVEEFEPLPKNVGRPESVAIVNRWIEENKTS
jgi:hypothetical protein